MVRSEVLQKMEHQDQTSGWRECLCGQTQEEFGECVKRHEIGNEKLDPQSDLCCSFWADSTLTRVKNLTSRSFAVDARMRLDSLKSGCNTQQPWCSLDNSFYYYDSEKDLWDGEDSEEEKSALDVVEILDFEESMGDEESWLYEPPNKHSLEARESALRWCRHILDNPSPEMNAARRRLINKLDQKSRCYVYRHAAVSTHSPSFSLAFAWDQTSVNTSFSHSESLGLRQEYISTPASAPLSRNPDTFSYSNTEADRAEDFSPGHENNAPGSPCKLGLTAAGSPSCKLPIPAAKTGCHSPKLTKLHQQVTQFKVLRLAQNKASPGRTRSPLQTSLRSLQAVRNSRSIDVNDYQPAGQTNPHPQVVQSSRNGSSHVAASLNSSDAAFLTKDYQDRITTMKRQQRSQSLSPSRITHPSKKYRSARERVFASPERLTSVAWGRHASSVQR